MADQVTIDNGSLTDFDVSTDDAGAAGHIQRVKLAYSADGVATHVTADADGLLVNLGANNDVTVSGVSTAANQSTIIGHLDGVEGLLTTIDADTGGIATSVATVAGAVAGTEMQVDIVSSAAVPVTDNSGSLTVDAPVGTPVFVRLSDGSAAITTLPVSLASVPSHAVTNAGTFAVQVTSVSAGDNNIGNVDIVTLPALAAGTNNIGDVDVLTLPATTLGHKAYTASIASALTTELDALGNNSNSAASSAIDNTSNLDLYHDLALTVATQGVARSAGATIEVYLTMALDGSNYDDTSEATAELVAVFSLDAATTARQVTRRDVPIPPGLFKYFVRNRTGQSLAANSSLLEYRAHSRRIA